MRQLKYIGAVNSIRAANTAPIYFNKSFRV